MPATPDPAPSAYYQMSPGLVDKILLCATMIAGASGLAEYQAHIFPISMLVDSASAVFLGGLLLCRRHLSIQLKLVLMLLTGMVIALTSMVQNPYAPDGYMVMGGVLAVAFAHWPLRRAMLIPLLAVLGLVLITVLIQLHWVVIPPFTVQAENAASAWLILAMCMALMSVAIGGTIHELKARLLRHIGLLEGANARLEQYAFHDEGTGLGNERSLEKNIDADLAAGRSGCLLVLQLSGMELFHAIHGGKERDEQLRRIAQALTAGMPAGHLLAKLDGAQFALWARDVADSEALYQRARQCVLADPALARFGIVPGAASVSAPRDGASYRELMKNIQVALSMMPAQDFAGCLPFSADMARQMQASLVLKQQIRHALDHNGFYPVYQAKVHSSSHRNAGFEALARISGGAEVPGPGVFIPVLHEEGWMAEFGMLMLRRIIDDIPALVQAFGAETKVAANVSPPLFLSPEFVSDLTQLVQRSGIDPTRLIIEITEEVFAIDVERIRRVCRELQQLGIQISLDDFGSGFSSLSFLRSMHFDEIKIDRSFIASIEQDEKSFLLLTSICKLGQDLQCRVVVEGVETAAQLTRVEQTACTQIQGFLFARPLPLATILAAQQGVTAPSQSLPVHLPH
ncbi:MAG: EAL domain-containing protein [Sphingomonadaceae bacterium]